MHQGVGLLRLSATVAISNMVYKCSSGMAEEGKNPNCATTI